MVEDETGFAITDKIVKAIEIRNNHSRALGHRFQWRNPKSFAELRERWVNEKSRRALILFEHILIAHSAAENHLLARSCGAPLKIDKVFLATAAKFFFRRADNHKFPVSKNSARAGCKRVHEQMHAFFGMNAPDVENNFVALRK